MARVGGGRRRDGRGIQHFGRRVFRVTLHTESTRFVTTLTVGHVTHDRFAYRNRAGGSAFYGARALHALGVRSRLVCTVGVDFECHCELQGLEMLLTVRGATTTFENSYSVGGPRV